MTHFAHWFAVVLLMVVVGCGPAPKTNLQETACKLKSGMNRANVDSLFGGFSSGAAVDYQTKVEENLSRSGDWALFETNISRGYRVGYWPDGFFSAYELCDVYFDTNDMLVAYSYSRAHYRGVRNQ